MKTILKLDASLLKESYCPCKFHRTGIVGYRESKTLVDVQYGTAVHHFISTMYKTGGNFLRAKGDALETFHKPVRMKSGKEYMTDVHLLKTCLDIWEHIQAKEHNFEVLRNPAAVCYYCDGTGKLNDEACSHCAGIGHREQPFVEMNFAIPFWENDEFIVMLQGTMDRIVQIKNGCICIRDWKTTSSWKEDEYLKQYEASPQLQFYVFCLYEYAARNPDSPLLQQLTRGKIGACIDGIFLKGAKECTIKSSPVHMHYSDTKNLERFRAMLMLKIKELVMLARGQFGDDYKRGLIEGTCHNGWGLCKYFAACAAQDEVIEGFVLKNNFIIKPYDPLAFND